MSYRLLKPVQVVCRATLENSLTLTVMEQITFTSVAY